MKKFIWLTAIVIFPTLSYAQTANEDGIEVSANLKAGAVFQSYPFELPGFNNELSSVDAKSTGFLNGADIIIKKKWLGMITTLYGRSCSAEESFYLETYTLSSFNSGNFFSVGILTGLYFEIPISQGVVNSFYAKLQAGSTQAYFPDQELIFTNSPVSSIKIENEVSAGFVSNIGLGIKFKVGENSALILDLNTMRETADILSTQIYNYTDIGQLSERLQVPLDWDMILLNPNIGFSYTF